MSAPQLKIELDPGPWGDDPQWIDYRLAGDVVSGRAVVRLDEAVNCRGVFVTVGWKTEGKGDADSLNVLHTTVARGNLPPGEHVYPFSTQLPEGPMSYSGHHIQIIWEATVRLDLAWRRDPVESKRFFVALPEIPPEPDPDVERRRLRNART